MFAPSWRHTASREGLGLGRHVCSQIAKSHGGQLSATSSAVLGTAFIARLPIRG
jgi:signal transduction histidine kinase